MSKGDLGNAEEVFQQGLELPPEASYLRGRIHTNLATLHLSRGSFHEATSLTEQALKVHRRIGYRHGEARNLGMLAVLWMKQDKLGEGIEILNRALEMDRALGYRRGEAREWLALAETHLRSGLVEEAHRGFMAAHDIAAEMNHRELRIAATLAMAVTELGGRGEETILALQELIGQCRSSRRPVLEIQTMGHIGLLQTALGRFPEAMICFQQAYLYSQKIGNIVEEAKSLLNLACLHEQRDETGLAAESMSLAQALLRDNRGSTPGYST
jgi:tetratricopeptide (TPR) repeat protein